MMDIMKKMEEEVFTELWEKIPLNLKRGINRGCAHKIYKETWQQYEQRLKDEEKDSGLKFERISDLELLKFVCSAHCFWTAGVENPPKCSDKDYLTKVVCDIINCIMFNFHYAKQFGVSVYCPEIAFLFMTINQLLIPSKEINSLDILIQEEKCLNHIIVTATKLVRSICLECADEQYKSAVSIWRTLHEAECLLSILANNPTLIQLYIKHQQYAMKQPNSSTIEELKNNFNSLKSLKLSCKKFDEYGWMLPLLNNPQKKDFGFLKMEELAGLKAYRPYYQRACETVHFSPTLIYGNDTLFYFDILHLSYSSFFNIDSIFEWVCDNIETRLDLQDEKHRHILDSISQYRENKKVIWDRLKDIQRILVEKENRLAEQRASNETTQ